MADTLSATGLAARHWDSKFFNEYVQENPFSRFMSHSEHSVLQMREDLGTKKGDSVVFAFVNKLSNDPITGSSTLEGNEEDMTSRSHAVSVDKRRNAVRVPEIEEQKSGISLRDAARSVLLDWAIEDTRDQVIGALGSIYGSNGVEPFSDALEADRSTWLTNNSDRVLFGTSTANQSAGDFAASVAAVESTEKATAASLSLLKRVALSATPRIRPMRVKNMNRRYYVAFVNPRVMRDLKADAALLQAQREVSVAQQNNKLFEGGDVEWDGIIVHEVDDIPVYENLGGAGGDVPVSPIYMCGAQAVGVAYAKRWRSVTEAFDYGDKMGVAVEAIMGIEKLRFGAGAGDTDNPKDHGVATAFVAASAD